MKTDQITIGSDGTGMEKALAEAERFAEYEKLDRKAAMHIRMLTEETLGMVRAIAHDCKARFWLEGDGRECRVCLTAKTRMDTVKREDFMAVSTSGRNEAAKGIMGKIRDLFEMGMESYEYVERMQMEQGLGTLAYGMAGMDPTGAMSQSVATWSMQQYRNNVNKETSSGRLPKEAWDELEKSIVANIADDVRVGIWKDRVEMTVLAKRKNGCRASF